MAENVPSGHPRCRWVCFFNKSDSTILMMVLFLTNTPFHFTRWTGAVWIIVMFLSAVWTLILMAPIHCSRSISEQVMQFKMYPDEETNSSASITLYCVDQLFFVTSCSLFRFPWLTFYCFVSWFDFHFSPRYFSYDEFSLLNNCV